MGADRTEKGEGQVMAKIFIAVALAIVCALELAFAIWDCRNRRDDDDIHQ